MFKTNGYETINDERQLIIINYNVFIKRGDRNIKENTIEMCILLVEFYFINELRTIIGLILVIFETEENLKKNIRRRQLIQER